MEAALDNLALAATSNKATVQQLMAANLAFTTTVATLTATNKKLVDASAKKKPGATAGENQTPAELADKPVPGGYCWTHGHRVCKSHTSETCSNKVEGHDNKATSKDTKGGSSANKDWHKA